MLVAERWRIKKRKNSRLLFIITKEMHWKYANVIYENNPVIAQYVWKGSANAYYNTINTMLPFL